MTVKHHEKFLLFQSAVSGNEVLILNTVYPGGPSTPREISIDVDSSISQMTIKIHGKNNVPNFILKNSYGKITFFLKVIGFV